MFSNPSTPGGDTPHRERLPSFLHAGNTANRDTARTPSASYGFPSRLPPSEPVVAELPSQSWPFQQQRPDASQIPFNDRLRTDRLSVPSASLPPSHATPSASFPAPAKDAQRTPSRIPPNKSMLDSGTPSVLMLQSPSASPAATPAVSTTVTPGSFARHTSMSPVSNAGAVDRWVTVFGFPPADESQVLREFRRHGEIVRTVPGQGNWIHILFRSPLQAQVALHKPWRILAGSDTMVGVVACTEPAVAKEMDENIERGILVASPSAVRASSALGMSSGMASPSPNTPGLRTPAAVMRRDQGQPSSMSNIVKTPQRQSGILDYITGFYK